MCETKELEDILWQINTLMDEFLEIGEQKLQAVRDNRITHLEKSMQKEQAAVLKLRGLEQKREKEQQRAGISGSTFRQILEQIPEEQAGELPQLYQMLSRKVKQYRSCCDSIQELLRVRLHQIDTAIGKQNGGVYVSDGTVKENSRHITDRRV